jgi:hypothetical protein
MCGYEKKLIRYNLYGFLVYAAILVFPLTNISAMQIASSVLGALFLINILSAVKTFQVLREDANLTTNDTL